MKNYHAVRFTVLLFVCLFFVLAITPALAIDPPSIKVSPVWRPSTQLTTIDTGAQGVVDGPTDDMRYAEVELYVTSSVQYWGVSFTCTVNKLVLGSYTNLDPDIHDDTGMVVWGPDWGDYTYVVEGFNPATGAMTFTAAKLGYTYPMGSNGFKYTQLVATLRYRVLKQTASPFSGTSPLTCTSTFLNQDGKQVLAATYTAPPPLKVISGYTISGKVTYGAAPTTPAGIGVQCVHDPFGTPTVSNATTSTTGLFSIVNLRKFGTYTCEFFGNVIAAGQGPDLHLQGQTWFNLNNESQTLLPVVLKSGNVERTITPDFIDLDDLDEVTLNWNSTVATAFSSGDANGDKKIDKSDLVIVAQNFSWGENVMARHLIYSLTRVVDTIYPNNKLWIGGEFEGQTTPYISGTNRDYWPALSPDGSQIAYTRAVVAGTGVNQTTQYALFVQKSDGTGTPLRVSPATNWTYDAFAPSWSPDGTRIAFVCPWVSGFKESDYRTWTYQAESGTFEEIYHNLCVVDANGGNFKHILWSVSRIYPPAWLDNNVLLFGGDDGVFGQNIYQFNLKDNFFSILDFDIPLGADMPVVVYYGGGLMYRYDDGLGDRRLRYADLDFSLIDAPIDSWEDMNAAPDFPYHVDVTFDSGGGNFDPVSTDVDYFVTIPGTAETVFYEMGGCNFNFAGFDFGAVDPTWFDDFPYWVHDQWCNPYWDPFFPDNFTLLFGLRNTVDSAP